MDTRPGMIAELALVALTSVAGALLAPQLPLVGLPLAASALGWLSYRFGYVPAVLAAILATGSATLIYGTLGAAVVIGPAVLLAGPVTAWALTRWSAVRVVTGIGIALFAVALAPIAIEAASAGTSVSGLMSGTMKVIVDEAVKSAASQQPGNTEEIKQVSSMFVRYAALLWPSSLLLWFGLPAALVVPVVSRAGQLLGRTVNRPPSLPELDLSIHLVWPVIAGLAVLAYTAYTGRTEGFAWAVGANLLLAVRPVLFMQGAGVFGALYRKAKVGKVGRTLGYALLAASEFAVPSISVVGLLDLFANLRRLPRGDTPPAQAPV
ncbi:MAG TPA: DUF2232 domain-containing protein [Coriobacteriia bacterium]